MAGTEELTIANVVRHDGPLLFQSLPKALDNLADNLGFRLPFLIRGIKRLDVRKQTRDALAERVEEVGRRAGPEPVRGGGQEGQDQARDRERARVLGLQFDEDRDSVFARRVVLGVCGLAERSSEPFCLERRFALGKRTYRSHHL